MVISNYRLPQIERPTEEVLDGDDKEVLAAFEIFLNGYKRAQKRTRAITKAYNELESITRDIIKKYEAEEISPKNVAGTSLLEKNNIGVKSSTPKAQDFQHKNIDFDGERGDIDIIDLTSLFDRTQQRLEDTSGETSPVREDTKKSDGKKRVSSPHDPSRDDSRQKFDTEMTATTSRAAKFSKKLENTAGNEENRPPLSDKSPVRNDSFSHQSDSRHSAKIGLAKSIYSIEMRKTPNQKSLKQSTLVFQPIIAKTDLTLSEKRIIEKPEVSRHWGNLFDEDYRTKKKNSSSNKEKCKNIKYSIVSDQRDASTSVMGKPEVDSAVKNDEVKVREEKSARKMETRIVIPTASQIDETARSLFDDEDPDDFQGSPDILYTCVESPVSNALPRPIASENLAKSEKCPDPIATTSKASQIAHSIADSIDETFFAPAEIIARKDDVKEIVSLAGCSKIPEAKNNGNNVRTSKRKFSDESIVDAGKELDDLALQDINWDAEISNDNWASAKRPLNISFDIPPEKANKSPKYAHKGKVERNKAKRSKLRGWDCWKCENYYGNMSLSEEELKKRMDACSRHKSKYNPRYYTPKGFWNPEFPETTDSSDCSENYPLNNRD